MFFLLIFIFIYNFIGIKLCGIFEVSLWYIVSILLVVLVLLDLFGLLDIWLFCVF